MDYQNLDLSERGDFLVLTIRRERALNALNRQTMQELHHFFAPHTKRPTHRGIILTGAGERAFVAGADIKEFQNLGEQGGYEMARFGHAVFAQIEQYQRPVIAVVNGFALGGGCELAMACHLRIAEAHAKFGQPEVSLGIIPGYGGTQRLVQYIGKGRAMQLLLTGDMINAQQALEWGLVNTVVEKGQGIEAAEDMLNKIGAQGPVAIEKVIKCVNAFFDFDANGFREEVIAFGHTTQTEDFAEGASAFVEKRRAQFKGR